MNVTQIKDAIRNMNQTDKIEIHRWLDGELAGDLHFRIGARRSIAIRQEIERTSKLDGKSDRPYNGAKTLASGRSIGDVKTTR
jgi:hypothetical protein